MKISLTMTYTDLACLINYCNFLMRKFDVEAKSKPKDHKPRLVAYTAEIWDLESRLSKKAASWPILKRKKTRTFSVSYMQGFILWARYDQRAEYIMINDKIGTILQHLTYKHG